MQLIDIRKLFENPEQYYDKEVSVGGWIRNNRDSKSFGFITLADGTYFKPLQVVYHDTLANFDEVCHLNVGALRCR